MVQRIEISAESTKAPIQAKAQKEQTKEQITVPVGQNEEKTDLNKPVDGYYIETLDESVTEQEGDNDDELNTSVDTSPVHIHPSIAINDATERITGTMAQAMQQTLMNSCIKEELRDNSFYKAQSMMDNRHVPDVFSEFNFDKKFNIYGKVIYEGNHHRYIVEEPLYGETIQKRDSVKGDLGIFCQSKSKNTKGFIFGSFTKTKSVVDNKSVDADGVYSEQKNVSERNDNLYSIYSAVQHKFKNNDLITGSFAHAKDPTMMMQKTDATAGYYLRKFGTLAEVKTTIDKMDYLKPVVKTDVTISLNPELASDIPKEENTELDETTVTNDAAEENTPEQPEPAEKTSQIDAKKWSDVLSPFSQVITIGGDVEQGLGLQYRIKRAGADSKFQAAAFGKVSTTQQEEKSKYYVTFGSGVKYTKNLGLKSQIKAEGNIKDRITVGGGNIFTADTNASFIAPKFTANVEAKRIVISKGLIPSYTGLVAGVYVLPTDNLNLYAEGSYAVLHGEDGKDKIANLQAGIIFNF